jgi:glycosyltransferase involved in cell wall biosynthesis
MKNTNRRSRVLLIAEAANPDWESVPLVGWSLAKALVDVVDVHLVTHCRNAAAIKPFETAFASVTYVDSERVARPLWKLANLLRGGSGKGWTMVTAVSTLSYYYFERLVWKIFRERIANGEFDLVHRITPLSPTTPSTLAKRCHSKGVPFLLGPLNGGVKWPKAFNGARKQEKEWLSHFRNAYKFLPGYTSTLRYSAAIVCGSLHTQQELGIRYQKKSFYIPENAIEPARFPSKNIDKVAGHRALKVCFLGRLVPYKGGDMLLEACKSLIDEGLVTVDIVGDGPQKEALIVLANKTSNPSAITFHGWVPHKQVHSVLGNADLLGFPSIREFGGGVVLEAMALGVVPLIIDYAGPGELVNDRCGFKLKMSSRENIIKELEIQLRKIAQSPEVLNAKSAECIARVQRLYTWAQKASQMKSVYDWVRDPSLKKPSFSFLQ